MAKKKANVEQIDLGWLVYADIMASDGRANAGPHFAFVLSTKEQIDVDDRMRVAPISHNTFLADPADIVPVDPSYGLDDNCFVICSWVLPEGVHRNAVIAAYRPGVNCEPFVKKVLQTIQSRRSRE